ncbi:MAG: hypothetical protein M1838_001052 [Thelocarpon superellum]|nr:MAG: hypothetical protein M1838_001052 [Thelocarpon superellum]
MTLPPSAPVNSSTDGSTSLRPRQRRFLSALDEDLRAGTGNASSVSTPLVPHELSPRPSRAISPIPQTHPSRSTVHGSTSSAGFAGAARGVGAGSSRGGALSQTTFASGLWENSWSTLQGLASNLLGGDEGDGRNGRDSAFGRRRKRPMDVLSNKNTGRRTPVHWGPTPEAGKAEDQIGTGSRDSREALVRAKIREEMLTANGHNLPDASGNYKRRLSDDGGPSLSAPPVEHDPDLDHDALVYIHPVRPDDTLAGVIIQFHCEPAAFRKANRLWPNDSIQMRKTVVLPVDACAVKGRPVQGPSESMDFLSSEVSASDPAMDAPSSWTGTTASPPATRGRSPSLLSCDNRDGPAWTHDSWVAIDGHPGPVEIARLPQRTLGFFPRRRRKSVSYSDLTTPSSSLDLSRPPGPSARRAKARSDSSSLFEQKLQGPGGVGSLGAGVTTPGPGLDQFNKYLAPHLPNVAPHDGLDGASGGPPTGLDNVGSAIEGWMKKMATRAAAAMEQPGTSNGGDRAATGDLIELSDGLDGSDDGVARARESTGREDLEGAVRGRFPMRGKTRDLARRAKGD